MSLNINSGRRCQMRQLDLPQSDSPAFSSALPRPFAFIFLHYFSSSSFAFSSSCLLFSPSIPAPTCAALEGFRLLHNVIRGHATKLPPILPSAFALLPSVAIFRSQRGSPRNRFTCSLIYPFCLPHFVLRRELLLSPEWTPKSTAVASLRPRPCKLGSFVQRSRRS